MVNTITDRNITDLMGIYARQTSNIESIHVWLGARLMVGVDATVRTKIVLCNPGIELIQPKVLCTFNDA